MDPYQERIPGGAPSEEVVSDRNLNQLGENRIAGGSRHAPRVLDHETQVVAPGESDSFLNVLRRSGIDADYWHAPLLTRNPECGVEVATLDRPVGEGVCFVVAVLSSARLIGAPDTGIPASEDIGTVSCGRVVARSGRWDGVDQWLREFGCEDLELGVGWPTS